VEPGDLRGEGGEAGSVSWVLAGSSEAGQVPPAPGSRGDAADADADAPSPRGQAASAIAGTTPCFPAKGGSAQTPLPVPALGTPSREHPWHPTAPLSVPPSPTHIFEGEDDGGDDPGHHDHNAQHAEEPWT